MAPPNWKLSQHEDPSLLASGLSRLGTRCRMARGEQLSTPRAPWSGHSYGQSSQVDRVGQVSNDHAPWKTGRRRWEAAQLRPTPGDPAKPEAPRTRFVTPGLRGPGGPDRPSQRPSCVWFGHAERWGTTLLVTRDSPSIQGDVPGPDPARAPLTRRLPGGARLSGAAGGGLPCQPRSARRSAAAPASVTSLVHGWATPDGNRPGRSTVTGGTSFRRSLVPAWGDRTG